MVRGRRKSAGTVQISHTPYYVGIWFFYGKAEGVHSADDGRRGLISDTILNEIYPDALDVGISVEEFWNYSIPEINSLMASYHRRSLDEYKQKVKLAFLQAQITENIAARMFNREVAPVQPWDIYPDLFQEEKKQYEEIQARGFREQRRNAMDNYYARMHER